MTNVELRVPLDKETRRRLDAEVQATGKESSEVVREALAAYFGNRPQPQSCLELARRHRLIGCGDELPSDLSTNPNHLEGFGR